MRNIDWKSIRDFAGDLCEFVAYGLLIGASYKIVDRTFDDCGSSIAKYDNAIKAIMNSGMYSHDKCEAAELIKRGEDAEYYKAIIHVAQDSRLYSYDKVELIRGLSEQ